MIKDKIGKIMYKWAEELWPITRSITGPGVRETCLIHFVVKCFKIIKVMSF